MHAIIRQGEGKYYVSAVFGYYKGITATDDYEKYLQNIYNAYYVVWDAEGKRLARCLAMVPDTKYILPDLPTLAAPNRLWREPSQIYIIPQVIIIDANQDNWRKDEEGVGCVDFLNRDLLDSFLDVEEQPKEILDKCRAMDAGYVYEETTEIKTEADIVNLSWASGGFHDAFIAKEELMALFICSLMEPGDARLKSGSGVIWNMTLPAGIQMNMTISGLAQLSFCRMDSFISSMTMI